jgi:hypothetical protein
MIAPNSDGEDTNGSPIDDSGGQGGIVRDPSGMTAVHAARMERRALRQRWPIKREKKRQLIDKLFDLAVGEGSKPREAISAARAIISAEGQNQQDDLPPPSNDNRVIIANMTAQEMDLLNQLYELRRGIPLDDELTVNEPEPEENGDGDYIPS